MFTFPSLKKNENSVPLKKKQTNKQLFMITTGSLISVPCRDMAPVSARAILTGCFSELFPRDVLKQWFQQHLNHNHRKPSHHRLLLLPIKLIHLLLSIVH